VSARIISNDTPGVNWKGEMVYSFMHFLSPGADSSYLTQYDKTVSAAAHALEKSGLTVSAAESCTGGLLGAAITEVSGASLYFKGGVIAYDNKVKEKVLSVPHSLLEAYGAVSALAAEAMAAGVRELLSTSVGLAITGVAGPCGGSPAKPVGTTFVALSANDTLLSRAFLFAGDRSTVRTEAVMAALHLLINYLDGDNSTSKRSGLRNHGTESGSTSQQ
jgi:nicotinamide-nucleotide amidase